MTSRGILALGLLVVLGLAPLVGAAAGCTEPPSGFGVFVAAMATVDKTPPKVEVICYLQQLQADGKAHVANDGSAKFDAYYAYRVGAERISVSAASVGVKETALGGGNGAAHVSAAWLDTLTAHSSTMKKPEKGVTAEDVVTLTVRLLQDSARCSGNAGDFWYYSVGGVNVKSVVSVVNTSGETFVGSTVTAGEGLAEAANYCPSNTTETGTIGVLIGFPFKIDVAVQVLASGAVAYEHSDAGSVQAGRGNVRVCFEHPKQPSDLTLSSASGASYWCN